MEIFRSVLGGGRDSSANSESIAETIETVVNRLSNCSLLEDRRDACRHLRALSTKFRVEVGVQSLGALSEEVLVQDRSDEEILSIALETLCNIVDPEIHEDEKVEMGGNFTDIFLKRKENVHCVLELLGEYEFRVRRPSVKLLTFLLMNRPKDVQETVLSSTMGVSRLMDVLADEREVLRNDALLLLIHLTRGNANLQKIVAFENCFDRLLDIFNVEGYSDGGIIVEDCLCLMLNLLRNNPSNQMFFREGSYIQRTRPFLQQIVTETNEVGWPAQKVTNTIQMLQVLRALVSPSNSTAIVSTCQSAIRNCDLLTDLCKILQAVMIPADVLIETISTISEVIRGNVNNQKIFANVEGLQNPPRSILTLLLISMTNEKQPLSLRCAVLYCFQCFLHHNPLGQEDILKGFRSVKNKEIAGVDTNVYISTSELLFSGLHSSDRLCNWFCSVAIAHVLVNHEALKLELLSVEYTSTTNEKTIESIPFLVKCFNHLQNASNIQSKIGILMLLSTWLSGCTKAVLSFLKIEPAIPFLTSQICSNEHDETMRVCQGLCAFLLGICMINIGDADTNAYAELIQLIKSRIGFETFLNKFNEVSKHDGYNKSINHPQLRCSDSSEIIFDHKWCKLFKQQEHKILHHLEEATSSDTVSELNVTNDYKKIIEEQDSKLRSVITENERLTTELLEMKEKVSQLHINNDKSNFRSVNSQHNGIDKCSCESIILELRKQLNDQKVEITSLNSRLEQEMRSKKEISEEQEDLLLMLTDQYASIKRYEDLCLKHDIAIDNPGTDM